MMWLVYHNDPEFSDRQFRANSADPDQTAPTILPASFGHITIYGKAALFKFQGDYSKFIDV